MIYYKPIAIVLVILFCCSRVLGQHGRINTHGAKLRQCDDLRCPVLQELNEGENCMIIGKGKTELLDNYGEHAWLKVQVSNINGYVFGGLLDVINNDSTDIPFGSSGFIRQEGVNVRSCAGIRGCDIILKLKQGTYCKIISRSKKETSLKGLGSHPWYFVEVNNKKGYVFGGLVTLQPDKLWIVEDAQIYNYPDTLQGQIINTVLRGDSFDIKSQSKKSQLLRPYGRYYWYELWNGDTLYGWVFGAFTSKALEAPVDCQCVDFIKNILEISGPTKNAFEWDQVLLGRIPVSKNSKEVFLNYVEILDINDVKKGDIAIFHRNHTEANPDYGHIGIVHRIFDQDDQVPTEIGIEGANHQMSIQAYYSRKRCNNVSLKKYSLDENVRFYRAIERINSK